MALSVRVKLQDKGTPTGKGVGSTFSRSTVTGVGGPLKVQIDQVVYSASGRAHLWASRTPLCSPTCGMFANTKTRAGSSIVCICVNE